MLTVRFILAVSVLFYSKGSVARLLFSL